MPQFWWVNHNQTARQEIDGQYLWSPKTEKGGAKSEFYNNMRRAAPGDIVLSFSRQAIRFVGRVTEFAFAAPKPEEFGRVGANWDREGWLLPVFWTPLSLPVRPKDFISVLGPLLPTKYSPISPSTGGGYQKAYLTSVSESVFDVVVRRGRYDVHALLNGGGNSLSFEVVSGVLDDAEEERVLADDDLSTTVKQAVIQARRGQGKFRSNVEAIEQACRLTGVTNPALLIASHIKPWRSCRTAEERLDGMNGLMLTPDADHLFDRGYVSFGDDGEVLVSPRVPEDDLRRLGFGSLLRQRFGMSEAPAVWRTDRFRSSQNRYLDFHRKQVFIS
ncbi:MAG: HNH endonuclease [Alcaligenaceae bacterium]|nr:MAG: HNH endonuclease [Alcaligenaceae bacterium]